MTTTMRILVLAAALTMVAAPVHADDEEGHSHDDGHSHDHGDDVVLWEGAGRDNEDCSELEPGQIRWELDPGADHDVTSVELHIDEPEASVTRTDGPPFQWVSPFYELDLIEADADGFVGTPGDDAELRIVAYCPGGSGELPRTGTPLVAVVLTGVLAIAALAGGARLARRRPSG